MIRRLQTALGMNKACKATIDIRTITVPNLKKTRVCHGECSTATINQCCEQVLKISRLACTLLQFSAPPAQKRQQDGRRTPRLGKRLMAPDASWHACKHSFEDQEIRSKWIQKQLPMTPTVRVSCFQTEKLPKESKRCTWTSSASDSHRHVGSAASQLLCCSVGLHEAGPCGCGRPPRQHPRHGRTTAAPLASCLRQLRRPTEWMHSRCSWHPTWNSLLALCFG